MNSTVYLLDSLGVQLFAAGWFFTDPLNVTNADAVLLIVFGLVFAVATVLWIEGTRLIPAAESGLLGSAETPVAIAMAWIILSETPPLASIIGAIIVLAAVLLHAGADFTSATHPPPFVPGQKILLVAAALGWGQGPSAVMGATCTPSGRR